MNINQAVKLISSGKSSMRSLLFSEAIKGKYTQKKILDRYNQIIASLPEFPRYVRSDCMRYFEGMFDSYKYQHIIFLYKVDNKFYCTSSCVENLPNWDTLPKEQWSELGDKGGLYYSNTHEFFF